MTSWLSFIAIIVSMWSLVVALIAISRQRSGSAPRSADSATIRASVLHDARSFFVTALTEMQRDLASERTARLAALLLSVPELSAFPVISDRELARRESALSQGDVVWILTRDENIEFNYGAGSGDFANVVAENLKRNVEYRYLIPRSTESEERSLIIRDDFPKLRVRLFDPSLIEPIFALCDEYVIYQSVRGAPTGYILFPDGQTRRWVQMDPDSLRHRLGDADKMWSLSVTGQPSP